MELITEKFVTLQFYDNGRGFDTSRLGQEDNKGMESQYRDKGKSIEGVFILEVSGKGTSALINGNDYNIIRK